MLRKIAINQLVGSTEHTESGKIGGRGEGWGKRTAGFKRGVGEVCGFRAGFADFEFWFGEVCFFGGAFAGGGAHFSGLAGGM